MNRKQKILELAKKMGIIRPRDVEAEGISRMYLHRMYKKGEVERIGRGLYVLPQSINNESFSLAEVSKHIPNGVICLISALHFHELTTQIPHKVWIAIENKKWEPESQYPPIEIIRLTGSAFSFGIEIHKVNNVTTKIYSPAKTVADCFKFRNKIGLDIALEALKETKNNRKATVDELWEAAKVCKMTNVMRPYLEAIV